MIYVKLTQPQEDRLETILTWLGEFVFKDLSIAGLGTSHEEKSSVPPEAPQYVC